MSVTDVERVVKERYREGARRQVAESCCPVDYDPRHLEAIPQEVLDRDYGCGDPSRHLGQGEVVLDLCDKTFRIYQREPYGDLIETVEPQIEVAAGEAASFDCSRDTLRHPRETKGKDYGATSAGETRCEPGDCC